MPLPLSCELLNYTVDCLSVQRLVSRPPLEDVIRPDFKVEDDHRCFRAMLVVRKTVDGVQFFAAIQGNFRFGEEISSANAINAWENGCTILYGVLRGLYTPLMAQCAGKVSCLPSVMMRNEVIRRINEKKPANTVARDSDGVAK